VWGVCVWGGGVGMGYGSLSGLHLLSLKHKHDSPIIYSLRPQCHTIVGQNHSHANLGWHVGCLCERVSGCRLQFGPDLSHVNDPGVRVGARVSGVCVRGRG
jgi:hypothetical protein